MDKCIVAILPMKGHSERVPNKNMRMFHGKPLYHRITNTLLESKYVKKIYIDTDSDIIIEDVRINFPDIELIKRSDSLIGDFISMNDIIYNDIQQIEEEYFLQTHCTNPLITSSTIDKAAEIFLGNNSKKNDSLLSVNRIQKRLYNKEGKPINDNLGKLKRTQDIEPIFSENSCMFFFTKHNFIKYGSRVGRNPYLFEMDLLESIDIDEEEDFILAERLFNLMS